MYDAYAEEHIQIKSHAVSRIWIKRYNVLNATGQIDSWKIGLVNKGIERFKFSRESHVHADASLSIKVSKLQSKYLQSERALKQWHVLLLIRTKLKELTSHARRDDMDDGVIPLALHQRGNLIRSNRRT